MCKLSEYVIIGIILKKRGVALERIGIKKVSESAVRKVEFFNNNFFRMLLYSIMSGQFLILAGMTSYSIAGELSSSEYTYSIAKLSIGVTYAIGLTLIVYCGAELFTGDVMVISVGVLTKKVKLWDAVKFLCIVFIGNFIGAAMFTGIIHLTGLLKNELVIGIITASAEAKMTLPIGQSFWRAILCNMFVCLAVWGIIKNDSKSVQLSLIGWCVLGFIASGYEHVIANFGQFMMAMLNPNAPEAVSWVGFFRNVIPVTLGNIVGGVLFVGVQYFIMGTGKEQE